MSGPDPRHRVADRVLERQADLVALTADLIGFDTTALLPGEAPRDEDALQACLAQRLGRAGGDVRTWEPDPKVLEPWASQVGPAVDFEGRPQLLAHWSGRGAGRSLILNGHIDVVSAEPVAAWTGDPFVARIHEGRIVGRGACDMKGGIAAMIIAVEAVIEEVGSLEGDLYVNTVTDEESSGAGALATIASGLQADGVIVPEPTSFDVWVACRGSLTPTIEVSGRAGHAELPHPSWQEGGAVNAIEKLAPFLEEVVRLRNEWHARSDHIHPYLAPGTIVPVLVSGGEWFVTYPAHAELTCELMYLPTTADPQGGGSLAAQELCERIGQVAALDEWLTEHPPEVKWGSDIPPYEIPADHGLAQHMLSVVRDRGLPGQIAGFNSWFDGASFARSGSPAIGFGPPRTADAHTVDESVRIDDLVACAQALAVMILNWCG